jgi:virginiamycin B lyase
VPACASVTPLSSAIPMTATALCSGTVATFRRYRLPRTAVAAAMTTAIVVIAGCGTTKQSASGRQTEPRITVVQLPRNSYPDAIAVSNRGVAFVAESGASAVAEVKSDGHVRQQPIPTSEADPSGVTILPTGVVWFAGFEMVGMIIGNKQIDFADFGREAIPAIGVPEAIAATQNGTVWFSTKTHGQAEFASISPRDTLGQIVIPNEPESLKIPSIVPDAYGDLWFTQAAETNGEQEYIGQISTVTSQYRRWKVPDPAPGLEKIAKGRDGDMWFTERAAYRIGRISTSSGRIVEFPLPPGAVPTSISEGPDGDMWFTTETKLGRITPIGRVALLPIIGAEHLDSLASDHRDGLWIADSSTDRLYHITDPE